MVGIERRLCPRSERPATARDMHRHAIPAVALCRRELEIAAGLALERRGDEYLRDAGAVGNLLVATELGDRDQAPGRGIDRLWSRDLHSGQKRVILRLKR